MAPAHYNCAMSQTATTLYLGMPKLQAGLEHVRQSPKDGGVVEMIVRRPKKLEREVLHEAQLDLVDGLVGDNWKIRGSQVTRDGLANPEQQITIMNARAIALVAQLRERWPLAGDQLLIDLDLSAENVPSGTRLVIGSAVLEITAVPHTGCGQFKWRFGHDALMFVNSAVGKQLRLRGVNAKVVQSGIVRIGDLVTKVTP